MAQVGLASLSDAIEDVTRNVLRTARRDLNGPVLTRASA